MNWTTASIGLNDSQAQIRDADINGLSVQGDHNYRILITVGY